MLADLKITIWLRLPSSHSFLDKLCKFPFWNPAQKSSEQKFMVAKRIIILLLEMIFDLIRTPEIF